jgi:hypothetical protein
MTNQNAFSRVRLSGFRFRSYGDTRPTTNNRKEMKK